MVYRVILFRLTEYRHLASLLLLTSRNKHTGTRVERISGKSLGNLIEGAFWNVNCAEGCAEGCAERQAVNVERVRKFLNCSKLFKSLTV